MNANNIPEKRARLAVVEERLARLSAQYDLAMSTFKFDEARQLSNRVEATTRERDALAADLPSLPQAPAPVPVQVMPRRLPLRRRRR